MDTSPEQRREEFEVPSLVKTTLAYWKMSLDTKYYVLEAGKRDNWKTADEYVNAHQEALAQYLRLLHAALPEVRKVRSMLRSLFRKPPKEEMVVDRQKLESAEYMRGQLISMLEMSNTDLVTIETNLGLRVPVTEHIGSLEVIEKLEHIRREIAVAVAYLETSPHRQ